jgi:hypothetical protein
MYVKTKVFISVFFFSLFLNITVYAEDETEYLPDYADEKEENRLIFTFNEGAAVSWLTRIIYQSDRSNFVFEDFMIGLYFRTELENIKYFTPMARIAVFYPVISTFNKVPQLSNTPLHIGIDFTAGVKFELFDFDYVRLNAGPSLHLLFLTADRWNYFNLGGALFVGVELPLTKSWTLLCNGYASLDNGNLGTNSLMEPFDIAFQYQIDIGVRYSKKIQNRIFLFPDKTDSSTFQR